MYDHVDAVRKPGSIVSSNTSTIPLRALTSKQSDAFKHDFCITHFFNPPRYMRLLEIVSGPDTRPEAVAEIIKLCDVQLGKGVVHCKDTPGFIANRIGTYWITCAVNEAIARGIPVEDADAAHRPMGIPKTGVFGLVDLVGLDLMPLVSKSLLHSLPPDDDFRRVFKQHPLLSRMIADGNTGRKGKGGFYRLNKARQKEAMDLVSGEYRPATKPKPEAVEAGRRDLGARHAGHDIVDHHDVGRDLFDQRDPARSVARFRDLITELAEARDDEPAHIGIVIDHDDARHDRHRLGRALLLSFTLLMHSLRRLAG